MIVSEALSLVRRQGAGLLRSAMAGDQTLETADLANPDDFGLFGPASSAWRVHGDAAMLIGGLRALLLQTLHPLAMAGVADHSDYRHDPWGRLHRTGRFVGATTFGTTRAATIEIERVKRVHERVVGHAPDGRPYAANDPHLMLWVHVTEVDSFLTAFERYGHGRLTDAEKDRYVAEMAEVARRLGTETPPTNRRGLDDTLERFRSECAYTDQAKETVRFLLVPPVPLVTLGGYGVIAAAAIAALPDWARSMLRLPLLPGTDTMAIRPAAVALTRTVGWFMSYRRWEQEDRLLTG
jgi:uncharacterized protein (DUF2236 family)